MSDKTDRKIETIKQLAKEISVFEETTGLQLSPEEVAQVMKEEVKKVK